MKAAFNITGLQGLIISLLMAIACGAYAVLIGQDINWDLLNYHLYNPYSFLNDRVSTDLGPAGVQSWFSPMLDLLYYGAATHLNPKLVGFLLGFLQGLNFLLIYKIAGHILQIYPDKRLYSLLLALAGVLTVGFQAEIGTTLHDSLVALFPLTSLWIILTAISHVRDTGKWPVYRLGAVAGLIAGIGIGLKLVVAIFALGLCVALLVLPLKWLNRFKLTLFFGIPVLLGMFIVGGYWMFKMWQLYGNPLFPQFNHIFKGELATAVSMRDTRFLPTTLFDKVFFPVIFTIDPYRVAEWIYKQYSWLCAYIALLGFALAKLWFYISSDTTRRPWNPEASYLLAFFCISYFLWLNIFGIYRYLIVLELLIPLLLFVIITHILKTRHAHRVALSLIVVLTAVNLPGAPTWGRTEWADTVYRIESSRLNTGPEPAVVYLAGQPLGYIVPALDIETPFIQVIPNFFISEAYWDRAKMLTSDRDGESFIVFETENELITGRTEHAMAKLGLSIDETTCDMLVAYLGQARAEYRYCQVNKTESNQ